jgi:alpha-1,6-mannosyltransferase
MPMEQILFPPAPAAESSRRRPARDLDISRIALPPRHRCDANLSVLDITKWFGETSGGVRTYLLQKANYVEARARLRQVLVIPGAQDSVTGGSGVRCYRLRGPKIPTQRPYRFMLATRSIRRIVEHERPDVIEVGSPFLVPWITHRAARRCDVPLVAFYHSNFPRSICAFPERARGMRRQGHELAWRYVRKLDRLFETTIVASRFAASDLQSHGVERITHVPLGVDLEHFHPRRRSYAEQTRLRLGLPTDVPVAAFVGRFAREKEVGLVIKAWETVEKRTDAVLALVGDGPIRKALRAQAKAQRIIWLPYQTDRADMADLLASIDLLVSPGSIETFGLSALEAQASGTAVLSADRGGVAEQLQRSGAGALFPAGDQDALAECAIRLITGGDLASLGARGRAYAEREHSWSSVFDRIFDVYRAVVA